MELGLQLTGHIGSLPPRATVLAHNCRYRDIAGLSVSDSQKWHIPARYEFMRFVNECWEKHRHSDSAWSIGDGTPSLDLLHYLRKYVPDPSVLVEDAEDGDSLAEMYCGAAYSRGRGANDTVDQLCS